MNDSDLEWFRNQTRAQIDQLRADILAHHQALHGTAAEPGAVEKLETTGKRLDAFHKQIQRIRFFLEGSGSLGVPGLLKDTATLESELDELESLLIQKFDEWEKREIRRALREEVFKWSILLLFIYAALDILSRLAEYLVRYR